MRKKKASDRLSTGVAGLDEVLCGGFIAGRSYLVRGGPGTGKTTLGLHFLTEGVRHGERALLITLTETEPQIRANAETMGFDLSGVSFLDLSPGQEFFAESEAYDIFSPAEVERQPTTTKIIERIDEVKPQRIFLDVMPQLRYLSQDVFQFRRQSLSMIRYFIGRGATVLLSSESTGTDPDDDIQFLADGVISLESSPAGRNLVVMKLRGSDFRGGVHCALLGGAGLEVLPRLLPEPGATEYSTEILSSGVPELDELLNGGLDRGGITLITGPSGVGKTTLGLQFLKEAAGRGDRCALYSFEEQVESMLYRCAGVNIPAESMVSHGNLSLVKVEPLRYSADEFAHLVRRDVVEKGTRMVMIDGVSGYRLAVQGVGADLIAHLHALCKYLQKRGVTVLLINEVEAITGDFCVTEHSISYMADNIIFFRYVEVGGEMRKAIGVLKKRTGPFERTLREFEITRYGIKVGEPLTHLRGILTGIPHFISDEKAEVRAK